MRYAKYLEDWEADEARPKFLHFAEFYDATAKLPGVAKRTHGSWREALAWGVKSLLALWRK